MQHTNTCTLHLCTCAITVMNTVIMGWRYCWRYFFPLAMCVEGVVVPSSHSLCNGMAVCYNENYSIVTCSCLGKTCIYPSVYKQL